MTVLTFVILKDIFFFFDYFDINYWYSIFQSMYTICKERSRLENVDFWYIDVE